MAKFTETNGVVWLGASVAAVIACIGGAAAAGVFNASEPQSASVVFVDTVQSDTGVSAKPKSASPVSLQESSGTIEQATTTTPAAP